MTIGIRLSDTLKQNEKLNDCVSYAACSRCWIGGKGVVVTEKLIFLLVACFRID